MEEITKSVNPMDLDPSISGLSNLVRSEHVSTEALLKNFSRYGKGLRSTHNPLSSN